MTPTAKLIQTIETAQTPYTVTFSANAQLLAYGDGFFYGGGRVVCLKPGAGVVAELVWEDVLPDEMKFVTTSGLCFDGSNDFIAVAAWRDRHGYYPAVVCRVADGRIVPFMSGLDSAETVGRLIARACGYATGAVFCDGKLVVRRSAEEPELALSAYALPSEVVTERIPYHLSSMRLTPLGGGVLTGFGDELLVTDAKVDGTVRVRVLECPHEGRVEAIARNAAGDMVVTGGHDGSVCVWEASGDSEGLPDLRGLSTLSGGSDTAKRSQPSGTHVYDGVSITAACFLGEDNNFATTDASGRVRVWGDDGLVMEWSVPTGSPRSIAASPDSPLLAVACKNTMSPTGPGRGGHVFLYSVLIEGDEEI